MSSTSYNWTLSLLIVFLYRDGEDYLKITPWFLFILKTFIVIKVAVMSGSYDYVGPDGYKYKVKLLWQVDKMIYWVQWASIVLDIILSIATFVRILQKAVQEVLKNLYKTS